MTEGLYPPEGTPDGAAFYVRTGKGSPVLARWHKSRTAQPGAWSLDGSGLFVHPEHDAVRGWTILCHIPDPADLLRHEQRVQELLEANNRLVEENRRLRSGNRAVWEAHGRLADEVTRVREENRLLRAAVAHAGEAIQANTAILQALGATDESEPVAVVFPADGTMPQPSRRDGEPPCGECHMQPGEVCDICGAQAEPPPVDQGAHIQAYAEGSAAAMAGVDWCANPYRQPALSAEWNRGWQEQVKARVARELDDRLITRDEAARWLEGGWPHEPAPERQGPRSQGDAATPLASGNADTAGPGASPAA